RWSPASRSTPASSRAWHRSRWLRLASGSAVARVLVTGQVSFRWVAHAGTERGAPAPACATGRGQGRRRRRRRPGYTLTGPQPVDTPAPPAPAWNRAARGPIAHRSPRRLIRTFTPGARRKYTAITGHALGLPGPGRRARRRAGQP